MSDSTKIWTHAGRLLKVLESINDGASDADTLFGSLKEIIEDDHPRRNTTDDLVDSLIRYDRDVDSAAARVDSLVETWTRLDETNRPDGTAQQARVFRGGLGFLIGSTYMLDGKRERAEVLFRDPDTVEFIHRIYHVPKERMANILPYRFGTTSLVFLCGEDHRSVLKLLQLKYVEDETLTESFAEYKSRYGRARSAPTVHECGPGWILMEFIEGETLREFVDGTISTLLKQGPVTQKTGLGKEHIDRIRGVATALLNTLGALHESRQWHHDLSPSNILVTDRGAGIRLIDFGINTLLSRSSGSAPQLSDAQAYASPEVINGSPQEQLSDVYSFGVILLECIAGKKVRMDDLQWHLDDAWMRVPELAMVIDDCLTLDPEHRALEYRSESGGVADGTGGGAGDIFGNIRSRIVAVLANVEARVKRSQIMEIFAATVESAIYMRETIKSVADGPDNGYVWARDHKALDNWKRLCICAFCICALIVPTAIVFNDLDNWNMVRQLRSLLGIHDFTLIESLPGRLVCFSFALTATIYYVNIFQSLEIYVDDGDDPSNRRKFGSAKFWLRLNSFCFAVPILWAYILDPRQWPFCAALGLFFVGMNNLRTRQAATLARQSLDASFRVSVSRFVDANFEIFSGWDKLVFSYAAGLCGIGIFLGYQRAVLGDQTYPFELAFAIVAILLNYVKMQRENCTKLAPGIKTMLMYIFTSHRRLAVSEKARPDVLMKDLRSLTQVIGSKRQRPDADGVLIALCKRNDLGTYIKALENSGVTVTRLSADESDDKAPGKPISAVTVLLSPSDEK
ncbi:MAG: protein kinase [Boseongicola sp. SB0677_bin_26]|nr:protein kinase [Boseongicola sp. SB0665_bin_10]MYG25571.1 protein kinase [Boseongicola sp. SB0677_bin_26]